jgi:uroporphyrinogen decarboxylase
MPDVTAAGRIPVFLAAAQGVKNKFGNAVPVRGALSGPYSIAAELMGIEPLIMAMMTDEDNFGKLLDFTTSFSIAYGMEYIKRGVSVCMFDSQASPPLVSPAMFEKFLLPRYKKISGAFKAAGCDFAELVIGGRTDVIAKYVLQSGFDIVLSDFSSDIDNFIRICNPGQLIRKNISPVLIENGPRQELMEQIKQTKNISSKNNNVIIGTGVISYDCPVENVLEVKKILKGV